jgi:lipopolysaccharide export system permease protein
MNNKINIYFLREFLSLFIIILFSIGIIIWVIQAVNYLEFVTEDGHSFLVYIKYSLLNLPKIISRLLPFAFFTTLFLTISKFENNNELLILWVMGFKEKKLINFILLICLFVSSFQIIFLTFISPQSLNYARSFIKESNVSLIPSLLKEREFNDTIKGFTVFIDRVKENQEYENIFLVDTSNANGEVKTIIAKTGQIVKNNNNTFLQLMNGAIQYSSTEPKNKKINIINFDKTEINLSLFSTKSTTDPKFQEMTTLTLLSCFDYFKEKFNFSKTRTLIDIECAGSLREIKSEINRRFGMPLYLPVLALIVCFNIFRSKDIYNYSLKKYGIFIFSFLILIISEIFLRYSGKSNFLMLAYYFTPILFSLILYTLLVKKIKFNRA